MTQALGVLGLIALAAACADPEYRIVIDFEPNELADEVSSLELLLAREPCPSEPTDVAAGPPATAVSSRSTLTRGDSTRGLGEISPNRYWLYAIGRGDGCGAVAAGCVDAPLEAGGEDTITVRVGRATSTGCAAGAMCIGNLCVPPPPRDSSVPGDAGTPPGDGSMRADAGGPCTLLGDCETIEAIDTGDEHVCALLGDGRVACWGDNGSQQRGLEDRNPGPTPNLVPGVDDAVDLSAGGDFSCVVRSGGAASCWGAQFSSFNESAGIVAALPPVDDVEVGDDHTCFRLTDGTVRCFGEDSQGELGDGGTNSRPGPVTVVGLSSPTALALGNEHSCALVSGGLRCWGDNDFGQLGLGTTSSGETTPQMATIGAPIEVATGRWFTCALFSGGEVRCFGYNERGQLGSGSTSISEEIPVTVDGIAGATAVAAGWESACAIHGGDVSCWGTYAPLLPQTRPVGVGGVTSARSISMGISVMCIVETGGTVKCAGPNGAGEVGDGTTMPRDRFTPVLHF